MIDYNLSFISNQWWRAELQIEWSRCKIPCRNLDRVVLEFLGCDSRSPWQRASRISTHSCLRDDRHLSRFFSQSSHEEWLGVAGRIIKAPFKNRERGRRAKRRKESKRERERETDRESKTAFEYFWRWRDEVMRKSKDFACRTGGPNTRAIKPFFLLFD